MLIYVAMAIVPVVFYPLLSIRKKVKICLFNNHTIILDTKKLYIFLVLFILLLFSSLRRFNIGADYPNYVHYFTKYQKWYSDSEFGLTILYKIAYFLWGENYVGLAFIVNLLIFSLLYRYILKFSSSKYIMVVLLIFVLNPYLYIQSTFNALRQGIAMCFVCIAYSYLLNHNIKKFILYISLGVIFHKVSFIFVLLPFIHKVNWNKNKLFVCGTVCFLANIVIQDLSVFRPIFSLFNFEGYTSTNTSLFNFALFGIFVYFVFCFLLYYYDSLYKNKKEKAMIDLYLLSLAFLLLAVKNDAVYRVYIILVCLSLPAIEIILSNIQFAKFKLKKLLPYMYISYYIFYYIVFFISVSGNESYLPFRFYFN